MSVILIARTRSQQTFSVKGQIVNIWGLADHPVSPQPQRLNSGVGVKAALHNVGAAGPGRLRSHRPFPPNAGCGSDSAGGPRFARPASDHRPLSPKRRTSNPIKTRGHNELRTMDEKQNEHFVVFFGCFHLGWFLNSEQSHLNVKQSSSAGNGSVERSITRSPPRPIPGSPRAYYRTGLSSGKMRNSIPCDVILLKYRGISLAHGIFSWHSSERAGGKRNLNFNAISSLLLSLSF